MNIFYRWAIRAFTALASVWAGFVMSTPAQAQTPPIINCQGRPVTSLDFVGPVLESGTALQIGAIYRYSNVAPGVDSLVEITGFVNGGSLSLIDNDTGLVNYFQPELVTTGTSAVDFQISFVTSGTTTPFELDFTASSIDVDGNNAQLREYVEYADTSSGYVLNATTRLDRNASGPTPGTNRYESRTVTVAPGIDPTAEDNIVTVFYTDTSTYNFRIGSLGTGNMTRLTSQGYDCPNLSSPIPTPEIDEDFGDALLNNYGNPIHTIVPGVRLGASNTIETASYDSPSATGDTGDDGVSVPSFEQGETQILNVAVTGTGGYLQSWFDWNNDGDFLDTGEQVATNQQDGNNDGIIPLSVTAPYDAAIGNTIARFRWSTVANVSYQEAADDGEVEDYQFAVTTAPRDYSDAPLTGTSYGDAYHTIQSGIQLGASITAEATGYDTVNADGDSDDGISLPTLTQGQSANITANVSGAGGYLQGWIDWNNDGDWNDLNEQIATNLQDGDANGSISVPVSVPASASLSQTIARFRWSRTAGLDTTIGAVDGEVEDYALTIQPDLTGLSCPGSLVPTAQTGNAETVIVAAVNSNQALGALSAVGSSAPAVSARNNNSNPNLTLELEHLVPEGAPITLSIARNNTNGNSDIDVSDVNSGYVTQTIFNSGTLDILTRITVVAPAGGVKFIRIVRNSGSVHIDGIAYDHACVSPPMPDLQASKSVALYDPTNIGLYAVPGNDVIYTLTVSNAGDGAADADTIELIDTLPAEIEFWNGDIDDASGPESFPVAFAQTVGTGMTLTYSTDVRFGTGATAPANFAACSVVAPNNSYRPDLTYICLNPKGVLAAGDPDPTIELSFRSRIP